MRALPRWMKVVLAVLAVVLLPLAAFAAWLAVALSGGLDDVLDLDRPSADDEAVVQAREQAQDDLESEVADLLEVLPPAQVLARASGDRCETGQHNWKVDDDFDLDCTAATAVLLAVADDAALSEALTAGGWVLDPLSTSYAESGRRTALGWVRGETALVVEPVDPVTTPAVGYLLHDAVWEVQDGRRLPAEDVAAVAPPGGGTAMVLSTGYFRA